MNQSPGSEAEHMLRANSQAYERVVADILAQARGGDAEATLRAIERCAWMASEFHPGRFSDGTLENVALEIGRRLHSVAPAAQRPPGQRRRVLHVAPNLAMGGHGRLIAHWIAADRQSCHSIALTAVSAGFPAALTEAVGSSGGEVIFLDDDPSYCNRSLSLRAHAARTADIVVWHQIGPDVIPLVAFASPAGPPVVLIDHADHIFWLGSSVADMVVNLRSAALKLSTQRRAARRTFVLPIPLVDRRPRFTREQARARLGVEPDRLMLLSVGREMKYRPCGAYDFPGTAGKILDRDPAAELYVVGASVEGLRPWLRSPIHPRIHFVGEVDDPSTYHAAADLYLESFPYGSQTALLEAAMAGLPVVPAYGPLFELLVANDDALIGLLPTPADEQAAIAGADDLMMSADRRQAQGEALREALLREHVADGWTRRLEALYQAMEGAAHSPQSIPASSPQTTAADLGMSQWRGNAARQAMDRRTDEQTATIIHRALLAQMSGDFAAARHHAIRGILNQPLHKSLWRILLIALLGRKARVVKQSLSRLRWRAATAEPS